jgi:hypothetical protein
MIYTIKTDDKSQYLTINQFLKELDGIQYSVINEVPQNPAAVHSLDEFRKRIENSRESVKKGLFLTYEEIEK